MFSMIQHFLSCWLQPLAIGFAVGAFIAAAIRWERFRRPQPVDLEEGARYEFRSSWGDIHRFHAQRDPHDGAWLLRKY